LILGAEMTVVTLGTMRIIFVSRGQRYLAPVLGFFEVVIWLFAIGQIMRNLNNVACYAAFAAGFTAGNFLGLLIERRLAIGTVVVRVIASRGGDRLRQCLHDAGYGVTVLEGCGATGPVTVVLSVVPRRELPRVTALVKQVDPKLFYSVDDIQSASEGVFPERARPRVVPPLWPRVFRSAA
jgi:uncharacterized protein YebE (UPF0316 family)